ncbi:MAG: hypothetical protein NTX25_23850 [Proteobacteria bacterium]|nr:hypothetical protein [Pseudomonadota bacterium]
MYQKKLWTLCSFFLLSLGSLAKAQTLSQVYGDSLTRQAQTLYIKGTVGMTNFDSQAAGSKETRTTSEQELGGWLGESRIAGIKITNSDSSIPFELNHAQSHINITDVRLLARIWCLQPSVGISVSEIDVSQASEKVFGLMSTGINAGLGLIVNLHQGLVFNADFMKVHESRSYDKLNLKSSLGDRTDADAHFSFDLTERMLDFIVGYKMRDYTMSTEQNIYKESSQGAYAGLRFGFYF